MGFSGGQRQGTQYGTRHKGVDVFDIGRDISANMDRTDHSYVENNQQAIKDIHRRHYSGGRRDSGTSGRQQYGTEGQASIAGCRGKGSSLLGRDWLQQLRLDWHQIFRVRDTPRAAEVVTRHQVLFQKEVGEYKGPAATIVIDPNKTQRFCKARSVPYALRQRVTTS